MTIMGTAAKAHNGCEMCFGAGKIEVMHLRYDGETVYSMEPCQCTANGSQPLDVVSAQLKTILTGLQP